MLLRIPCFCASDITISPADCTLLEGIELWALWVRSCDLISWLHVFVVCFLSFFFALFIGMCLCFLVPVSFQASLSFRGSLSMFWNLLKLEAKILNCCWLKPGTMIFVVCLSVGPLFLFVAPLFLFVFGYFFLLPCRWHGIWSFWRLHLSVQTPRLPWRERRMLWCEHLVICWCCSAGLVLEPWFCLVVCMFIFLRFWLFAHGFWFILADLCLKSSA